MRTGKEMKMRTPINEGILATHVFGNAWQSLAPRPPCMEGTRQGIKLVTSRPVGHGINVNPDNDDRGKDAVTMNLDAAHTAVAGITGESQVAQKPDMTGNSDIVKDSKEALDVETLRRKVQDMKRK